MAQSRATMAQRLRTWWLGPTANTRRQSAAPAAAPSSAQEAAEEQSAPYWSPEAIEIAQRVWGPDHLGPAGEEYVRRVLKPLAIHSSLNIVELGSGLGGGARLIARDYDAWVNGHEADPALAEAAGSLSMKAGLARKAPVSPFDPETFELKKKYFDRIVVREMLAKTRDKARLLQIIRESMKARAQILMTEFVLAERSAAPDSIRPWKASEPGPTRPMVISSLLEALTQLNFVVHVAEDESIEIEKTIRTRWDTMRSSLTSTSLHPALVEPLLREGDRWQACADALSSGGLRYYRIVASG